jgi:hypothetical protein
MLASGAVGLIVWAALLHGHPTEALAAYLFVWLFFLGLSLGSLAAILIHNLTGGHWSAPVDRFFRAALVPLPLTTLLFLPIALDLSALFPWAGGLSPDGALAHFRALYLTRTGFLARSLIALALWNALTLHLRYRAVHSGHTALSAGGLIAYALSMSWAAVDWIGSLQPRWSSTALGLVVITGQVLGAFAFATYCATRAQSDGRTSVRANEGADLGNLMLTFVMTWMYLAFMQFLIIWGEDLPRETIWVLPRLQSPWLLLTAGVVLGQFALPFGLLLFRSVKRSASRLGGVALLLLLTQWLYNAWLILPSVRSATPHVIAPSLIATVAVGGLWLYVFLRALGSWGRSRQPPAGVVSAGRETREQPHAT